MKHTTLVLPGRGRTASKKRRGKLLRNLGSVAVNPYYHDAAGLRADAKKRLPKQGARGHSRGPVQHPLALAIAFDPVLRCRDVAKAYCTSQQVVTRARRWACDNMNHNRLCQCEGIRFVKLGQPPEPGKQEVGSRFWGLS